MKYVFCFLFIFIFISELISEEKIKTVNLTEKVFPVYEYNNYDGYFYSEDNDLMIMEAVFDNSAKGTRPVFIGYNNKILKTEINFKGRITSSNKSIYINSNNPSFIKFSNSEDFEKFYYDKLNNYPKKKGGIEIIYGKYKFMINYNNSGPIDQNFILTVDDKSKRYKLLEDQSFFIWHKVVNKYLVLALHSQGGSGHTITLLIYNIEDMLKLLN